MNLPFSIQFRDAFATFVLVILAVLLFTNKLGMDDFKLFLGILIAFYFGHVVGIQAGKGNDQ